MLKIIMFEEKHSTEIYVFSTDNERRAAYLDRLRTRMHPGYEWYPTTYEPYFHNDEIAAVAAMTEDEYAATAAALPPALADALHKNRKKALKAIRETNEANEIGETITRLLDMPIEDALAAEDGDGNILDRIMYDREDHEYEGFDIQTARVAQTSSS